VEIFNNIMKYNFKIEKNISAECADLIKNLLSPESKTRFKVKDIFSHPWVKKFEKELIEQETPTPTPSAPYEKSNSSGSNNSLVAKNIQFFNRALSIKEEESKKELQDTIILIDNQVLADINRNEPTFLQNQSNLLKSTNVSNFIDRYSKDSLFEKVISQVQEKNKKTDKYKKKQAKENAQKITIDYSKNVNIIPENLKENNISTLSIEKQQKAQVEIINNKENINTYQTNRIDDSINQKNLLNVSTNQSFEINNKSIQSKNSKHISTLVPQRISQKMDDSLFASINEKLIAKEAELKKMDEKNKKTFDLYAPNKNQYNIKMKNMKLTKKNSKSVNKFEITTKKEQDNEKLQTTDDLIDAIDYERRNQKKEECINKETQQ